MNHSKFMEFVNSGIVEVGLSYLVSASTRRARTLKKAFLLQVAKTFVDCGYWHTFGFAVCQNIFNSDTFFYSCLYRRYQ